MGEYGTSRRIYQCGGGRHQTTGRSNVIFLLDGPTTRAFLTQLSHADIVTSPSIHIAMPIQLTQNKEKKIQIIFILQKSDGCSDGPMTNTSH